MRATLIRTTATIATLLATSAPALPSTPSVSLTITNGMIYDGSGGAPYLGYVTIAGDHIVGVGAGAAPAASGRRLDAHGLAVAPGFVNMLSWANQSLIADGRGLSDIKQGVTLEVMGEGDSMGPLNPDMKAKMLARQSDFTFPVSWTSLAGYQKFVVAKGIAPNIASFVGATTVRVHELGEGDVTPTPAQLDTMRGLVRTAMNEGAVGVGSSLIYAPASYARTPELIALATESARCGGLYISHMRSEGDRLVEATDELIAIARASGGPAEIYHLKAAGKANWGKLDAVVARVEAARAAGIRVTADMYTYTAAATGLDAAMPVWVQAGGLEAWIERMKDPAVHARVAAEMRAPGKDWENTLDQAGSADNVLLLAFKNPALKKYTGMTLAAVARARGTTPEDTAIDLVVADGSRVGAAYTLMTEANVRREATLPWVGLGSDEEASADAAPFTSYSQHPRAYGNVARFLGKYVRDERVTSLADAVRRLSAQPMANLGIADRGMLKAGDFADVVIFDPATIIDHATFVAPRQYATGVREVVVNGVAVLHDGEPTGATPGRAVMGPGFGRCH